jgi:hypothetical protein
MAKSAPASGKLRRRGDLQSPRTRALFALKPGKDLTFIELVRTARMDQAVRSWMNLVTASAGDDAPDLTMTRLVTPFAGPDGVQFVDLGIYALWWTNLRTNKS